MRTSKGFILHSGIRPSTLLSSSVFPICLISFPGQALWAGSLNSEEEKTQGASGFGGEWPLRFCIEEGGPVFDPCTVLLSLCPALALTVLVSKTCAGMKTYINILEFATKQSSLQESGVFAEERKQGRTIHRDARMLGWIFNIWNVGGKEYSRKICVEGKAFALLPKQSKERR